jgi:drug/metabolite transporter (DMT)-like permease
MSWQSIFGIGMVVVGNIVLPMKRFSDFRLANYLKPSCLLGLLAACGTAGYSIIDDAALQHLRGLPMLSMGPTQVAVLYALMEGLSTCLWLALFVLPRRQGRSALVNLVATRIRPVALTGIGIYLTYPLVLISMAFVNNVSYVVAFRQISIPLGVAFGVWVFGEPRYSLKFWGAAVIFVGLVLVATG